MAFQFSLATLLRLREIAEQREERLLGQIQNQIAQTRQMLVALEAQRRAVIHQREHMLTEALPCAELVDSYAKVNGLEEMEVNSRVQLQKLAMLREQQMKVYQAAHRSSQVLSEMRDKQRDNFNLARAKMEQSVMDDNFSSRRNTR